AALARARRGRTRSPRPSSSPRWPRDLAPLPDESPGAPPWLAARTVIGGAPRLHHRPHRGFAPAAWFCPPIVNQEWIRRSRLFHVLDLLALFPIDGEANGGANRPRQLGPLRRRQ